MERRGVKPKFRIGTLLPTGRANMRRVLPFRKSWIAIGVLAVFDAVFLVPAVLTFRQAAGEWARFDSLFDLVAAVFLSAWLLGWSIAPLLMTGILLLMLFGREVLTVRPGRVELSIGLPLLGLTAIYDASIMRNLRPAVPPPKSGNSWRGPHLAFDYGANTTEFGSAVEAAEARALISEIETASRTAIRRGGALPAEVAGDWAPDPIEVLSATDEPEPPPAIMNEPATLTSASSLLLIAANLVPVIGAAFFGWQLSDVMVLYWAESAIIGIFNVCKIVMIARWFALLAGPFFLGHFGGFMAVHFLFIYTLFVKGVQGADSGGDLGEVWALFASLWPAFAALFLSHAYSFVSNFLGRQEYRRRTVGNQMSEPYSRIVFMHLVLIFGGGLTLVLGGPTPVLIAVIGLKIVFDLRAHMKEHGARKAIAPKSVASA